MKKLRNYHFARTIISVSCSLCIRIMFSVNIVEKLGKLYIHMCRWIYVVEGIVIYVFSWVGVLMLSFGIDITR